MHADFVVTVYFPTQTPQQYLYRTARTFREAIALRPDEPAAYYITSAPCSRLWGAGASYSGSAHTHYSLGDTSSWSSIAKR